MTTAPVADQRRLLEVAELDTRAAQIAHAREHHPLRAELAEVGGRLEDLEASLVTSRTAVNDIRRELAKAEADVEQVRTRAARDQARLEQASNARDAQALTSELEALARRQSALEDVELEVMERLEAHESALEEVTAAHAQVVEQEQELRARLDAALAELDGEAEQVAAERARRAEGLDAALVALYDRLRAQIGSGVAALRGRRCEGCRLELNATDLARITAAPEDAVVRCEECGRILVRDAP